MTLIAAIALIAGLAIGVVTPLGGVVFGALIVGIFWENTKNG